MNDNSAAQAKTAISPKLEAGLQSTPLPGAVPPHMEIGRAHV